MNSAIMKLARKASEIVIQGEKITVKPTPRDAELFLVAASGKIDEQKASRITEIMKNIIKRANPDVSDEDLDSFIAANYGELFFEIAVLFGFTTRDKLEELKKKVAAGITESQ